MQHARATFSLAANTPVSQAVRQASAKTGTEFSYLMRTAMRESSMNPNAKASGSSAAGLFQFVDQTWLGVMKNHGAEHGLRAYADAIKTDSHGRQYVPDPQTRREILALRRDPQISALMAGALTADNRQTMQNKLHRPVNEGELYAAHFLGADAASKLIHNAATNPSAPAAAMFPAAAHANRSTFYTHDGRCRSVAEVCERLTGGTGSSSGATMLADAKDVGSARTTSTRGMTRTAGLDTATAAAGAIHGGMVAKQPLMLSPRVIALLSSLDPIPGGFKPNRMSDDRSSNALNATA